MWLTSWKWILESTFETLSICSRRAWYSFGYCALSQGVITPLQGNQILQGELLSKPQDWSDQTCRVPYKASIWCILQSKLPSMRRIHCVPHRCTYIWMYVHISIKSCFFLLHIFPSFSLWVFTYPLVDVLRCSPFHDDLENRTEKSAVSVSLVLSTACYQVCDVIEYLSNIGNSYHHRRPGGRGNIPEQGPRIPLHCSCSINMITIPSR